MVNQQNCAVLARGAIGGTALSVSRYEPGWRVRAHHHEDDQLCVLLDGEYEALWSGTHRTCRKGTAIFHPAGLRHEDVLLDRHCWSLRIRWTDAAFITRTEALPRTIESPRIAALAEFISEDLQSDFDHRRDSLTGLLEALSAEMRCGLESPGTPAPGWLMQARDIVRSGYLERLGLQDVARRVEHGTSSLTEGFRRHFGTSVRDMIHRLRVEHAERLMVGTGDPLSRIALESGFCDQAHLGRVFRKLRGTTPSAWRRRRRVDRPVGPFVPATGRASKNGSASPA